MELRNCAIEGLLAAITQLKWAAGLVAGGKRDVDQLAFGVGDLKGLSEADDAADNIRDRFTWSPVSTVRFRHSTTTDSPML